MDVPSDSGIYVTALDASSPAEIAGIRGSSRQVRFGRSILPVGGDIITAIDDVTVKSLEELMVYLETGRKIGETVRLTIIRDGVTQTVPVTLVASSN